jgi:fructose-bisphosphate aldolase class II
VPDDELRTAVAAGIAKVNVGTALNVAMTRAVRAALDGDAAVVDPRTYLAAGRTAATATVTALLQLLALP